MELPQDFVPKNNPGEKLEELLKGTKEKRTYEASNRKYEYSCDICGKLAGSIEFIFEEEHEDIILCWPSLELPKPKSVIVTQSFLGTATIPRDEEYLELIMDYLDNRDLKSVLKEFDGDNLAFYCPTCDKCYCGDHWRTRLVMEDFGWYDYTMGTCPEGHERMIDD